MSFSLPAFVENYISLIKSNTKSIVVKIDVVRNWSNVLGEKI